ncbi:MAG: 3-isopropylmalate dehydratase, partial [Myxococcales bacterium]|nr:3-isopropylmalate dehydratase [Myxococcales bacterium]
MARRPMTLTQKILFDHAVRPPADGLRAGDMVRVKVDWTIASELAWNGMAQTYEALDRPPLHDKDRFYLAVDHTVDPVTLAHDPKAQALTEMSRDFAKSSGIKHFYDANETILHTKFYRDLVLPGQVVLGADSHTSSHGGMGAFAIGLGGADITVAMVLGESWIEVPEAIAVEFTGAMQFGFTGKEVILKTLGELGRNTVAMERSVEYVGEAVKHFT